MLEDVKEGAEKPVLPLVGQTNLGPGLVVALFVGLFLMAFIQPLSQAAASRAAAGVEGLTGINPQTGESGGNTAAFGGA